MQWRGLKFKMIKAYEHSSKLLSINFCLAGHSFSMTQYAWT